MEYKYEGNSLKSGIYKLTNKLNGRIYIGSAKEFKRRWSQHSFSLRNQKHQNKFLQADFNKCGEEAFVFEVMEVTDGKTKEERLTIEEGYIKQHYDNGKSCYNLCSRAISREGYPSKDPEKTRQKQSEAQKKRYENPEIRQRQSDISKAMWQRPEHIEKMKVMASSPKMLEKFQQTCHTAESKRKAGEQLAKYWGKIISPTGEVHDITNLNRFCVEHGLVKQSMIPVFNGEVYQAHGWRLYNEALIGVPYSAVEHQRGKEFEIAAPDGTVYRSRNIWEFCRVHGLQQGNLNKVLLGKRKSHKGWYLPVGT